MIESLRSEIIIALHHGGRVGSAMALDLLERESVDVDDCAAVDDSTASQWHTEALGDGELELHTVENGVWSERVFRNGIVRVGDVVVGIVRHGDRRGVVAYVLDPEREVSPDGCPWCSR